MKNIDKYDIKLSVKFTNQVNTLRTLLIT